MQKRTLLAVLLCTAAMGQAHALMKDAQQKWEEAQAVLDEQCEAGRQVRLEPIRAKTYDECMHVNMTSDTAEQCRVKAQSYNGQVVGGGMRFYDIPECVPAFEHRKLDPRKS